MQKRCKNGARTVQERCKKNLTNFRFRWSSTLFRRLVHRVACTNLQCAHSPHSSPGTWLHRFAVSNRTRDDGTLRDQAPSERVHSSRSSSAPCAPIFTLKTEKHSHCMGLSSYSKREVRRCDGRGDTERESRNTIARISDRAARASRDHRSNGVSPLQISMQTHPLSKKPQADQSHVFQLEK